jgi:hypothetical protein
MPKAATGRGEETTAASAVIPKKTPIVRMTLAPYEAVKVGHLKGLNDHQRALLAVGSYGRDEMRTASSRMSTFGGEADIEGASMSANDPKRTSVSKNCCHAKKPSTPFRRTQIPAVMPL